MPPRIDALIADVLRREGGFVHHPADRGGPTKFGITQRTLSRHLGRPASLTDVRELSPELAAEIYRRDYFLAPRIEALPERIQPFVFDCAVHHGPPRAIRFVQEVCNDAGVGPLVADGVCGPATRRAAAEADRIMGERLLAALVGARRGFFHAIVAADPRQRVFLNGWLNRLAEFEVPTEGLVA